MCTLSYSDCEPLDMDAPQSSKCPYLLRHLFSPGFMQQWKGKEVR